MKLRLDQWLHTEEYGSIDIVEQVQRCESQERRAGIEPNGCHVAREYNMQVRPPLSNVLDSIDRSSTAMLLRF